MARRRGAQSAWEEGSRAEMVPSPWSGEKLLLLEVGERIDCSRYRRDKQNR